MGNVSHVVPAIHPIYLWGEAGEPHARVCSSVPQPQGHGNGGAGAKALALTAYDLLTDGELLSKVKAEHGQASA